MRTLIFNNKVYTVDDQNLLNDFNKWDENFAAGVAEMLNMEVPLTKRHWDIIYFIRNSFKQTGECPLVYKTCKANKLKYNDLKVLFPTGYQRGACLLSGVPYYDPAVFYYASEKQLPSKEEAVQSITEKVYRVNVFGFLIDPSEWDEAFALNKANEISMQKNLSEKQWKIIYYLRNSYRNNNVIPTVYDCCEANQTDLEELEMLFPRGYHRGAVKIAGLRA
jgi:tRNA 2-thiouridine synthesizing protein E